MEQRHNSTLSPSNSMLVPYRRRQLAVAPPITAAASRFSIPCGWGVEEVPRPDCSRSDRYYYEPGTGRKFRSTSEVQRYLNGEEHYPRRSTRKLAIHNQSSGYQRMIVSDGKLFRLDNDELSPSHLAMVATRKRAPPAPYILPDGWIVEEVPRRSYDNWIDRYYYEPVTGQKFRSLVAVERYLAELEENAPLFKTLEEIKENQPLSKLFKLENRTKKSEYPRMIVSGGKLFHLDDELSQSHLAMVVTGKPARPAPGILTDGWIVEEVPRRYDNWTEKYYYEPGTGQRFRSLVAVERYLAELEENAPLSKALEEIKENKPLSKVFKLERLTKKSIPRKNISRENTQASSFISPPMKVNWVLASPQGDAWNPFICETLIPDTVKQQWTNRFMLFMNEDHPQSDF